MFLLYGYCDTIVKIVKHRKLNSRRLVANTRRFVINVKKAWFEGAFLAIFARLNPFYKSWHWSVRLKSSRMACCEVLRK